MGFLSTPMAAPPRCPLRRPQPTRGFTLIELALVVSLMAIIAMGALYWQTQALRSQTGNSIADNLIELDTAVSKTYIIKNYSALLSGNSVAGIANAAAPTVEELKAAGYLSEAFSPVNMLGAGYSVQVSMVPAGCVAPNCDLQSLVYLNAPILVKGTGSLPDSVILGTAQVRIGGNAGTSIDDPTTLRGPGGAWSLVNPLNQAGIIAIRGGYNASGLAGFLTATGNVAITNVVTVGGTCVRTGTFGIDSSGAFVMCQGGKWTAQGGASSSQWKDPVASFAALPGSGNSVGDARITKDTERAFAWTGAAWQPISVDQDGNMSIVGTMTASTVQITTVNTPGATCSPAGTLSVSSVGKTLACAGGVWITQGGTWRDPVANRASLPPTGNTPGDMRLTTDFFLGYVWANYTWLPVAADDSGNMKISGNMEAATLSVNSVNTAGSACTTNATISRDLGSNILSCKSGKWSALSGSYVSNESSLATKAVMPGLSSNLSYSTGAPSGTNFVILTLQIAVNGAAPCTDAPVLTFTGVGTSYGVKQRLSRSTTSSIYSWNNTFAVPVNGSTNQVNIAWSASCPLVSDNSLTLNVFVNGYY